MGGHRAAELLDEGRGVLVGVDPRDPAPELAPGGLGPSEGLRRRRNKRGAGRAPAMTGAGSDDVRGGTTMKGRDCSETSSETEGGAPLQRPRAVHLFRDRGRPRKARGTRQCLGREGSGSPGSVFVSPCLCGFVLCLSHQVPRVDSGGHAVQVRVLQHDLVVDRHGRLAWGWTQGKGAVLATEAVEHTRQKGGGAQATFGS